MLVDLLPPGPLRRGALAALLSFSTACRTPLEESKGGDDPGDENVPGCTGWNEVPYNGVDDDCDPATPDDDLDGDGYTAALTGGEDCDDHDASISPDAVEVCDDDDVDENCNGEADNSDPTTVGRTTFYKDTDGDGYGDEAVEYCEAVRRTSTVGGDCDDRDDSVYPGAVEVCDSADADEDCDGLSDDDDPSVLDPASWYADADGDGYGGDVVQAVACEQPAGLTADHSDCDDAEARTSPANSHELCGDGVRNGCDLSAEEAAAICALSEGDYELEEIGFSLIGDGTSGALATAVALGGDADGDGYGEVLLGDPLRAAYGGVLLFSGPLTDDRTAGADATTWIGASGSHAGNAVAVGGDVNGDGLADLLVGAFAASTGGATTGGAYLLYGPPTAHGTLDDWDVAILGETEGGGAGTAVDVGSDLNGDGFADLIISDPLATGQAAASGLAAVFYGPPDASAVIGDGDALLLGERIAERAGSAVSLGGDTDGDGYDDLLVSAPGATREPSIGGITYLVRGPVSTLNLQDAQARFGGEVESDRAGVTVSLGGDADGDGFADLLIGSDVSGLNGKEAGTAWLVLGPMTGKLHLSYADARIIGAGAGMACCGSVSLGGDADGDGRADLLIGDSVAAVPFKSPGRAHLFLGAVSGDVLVTDAALTFNGASTLAQTGASVAMGGDLNGDGLSELLIGAPAETGLGASNGAAWLVQGGGAAGPGI